MLTAVDPIKVTEYSIVLSAAALPLTYFPILMVANDPDYMGDLVNGPFGNTSATFYLVMLLVVVARHDPAHDRHEGGVVSAELPPGRQVWAGLELLDHQIVDRPGHMAGKVDDLELEPPRRARAPCPWSHRSSPDSAGSRTDRGRYRKVAEARSSSASVGPAGAKPARSVSGGEP